MNGLYESDVVVWSEDQAALLRRLASGERVKDLIDWPNVIEEIESVGNEQLRAVSSLLTQAMIHRLKAMAWPQARDADNWRADAERFAGDAADRFTPGRRSRIAIAGACALATAAATGSFALVSGSHSPTTASPAAVTLLAKIASAAERQPAPVVRDNQYAYVKLIEKSLAIGQQPVDGRVPASEPLTQAQARAQLNKAIAEGKYSTASSEVWSPVADVCREGLTRSQGRSVGFYGGGGLGDKCPSIGGLNNATYRLLQTLPRDPQALLDLINKTERGHGTSPTLEAFVTIGDLLRDKIAPPRVSAALYRAAASRNRLSASGLLRHRRRAKCRVRRRSGR